MAVSYHKYSHKLLILHMLFLSNQKTETNYKFGGKEEKGFFRIWWLLQQYKVDQFTSLFGMFAFINPCFDVSLF